MLPAALPPPLPPPHPPHHCLQQEHKGGGRPVSLGSVASDVYPLRVHWTQEGYEDKAEVVLGALELAWAVQVDELGWREPVLPDNADGPEMDLYLLPLGDWQAWAWAPDQVDVVKGDGFMGAPAYIGFDQGIDDDWVPIYVAHEFNHVLQYATDFTEETLTVWEATATATQSWTVGEAGVWDLDVADFQATPWIPVLVGDGYWLWDHAEIWSYYEYGAALWMVHLDRACGAGDGRTAPALWEALAAEGWSGEPDVADAIPEVCRQDLGEFLSELALSRWLVADDWAPAGLAEAEHWSQEAMVPALELETLPARFSFDPSPHITGQAFAILPLDPRPGVLRVEVSSARGLQSAVALLSDQVLDADQGADPWLEVEVEGLDQVAMVLTNLGPEDWDAEDASYRSGDQVISVTWTAAEPVDTGEGEAPGGCGCESARVSAVWLGLLPLWHLGRRRRGVSTVGS